MDLILKINYYDIEGKDEARCVYNYLVWKLKRSWHGITHIVEKYNDVDDAPSYELGYYKDNSFVSLAYFEWGEPLEDIMAYKLDALSLEFDRDSVSKLLST